MFFKENQFLSAGELRISVTLYIDDFEVCNPLGTSKNNHKLCAMYWILNNLPPDQHSSLSSIDLASMCKKSYIKKYGYGKVLGPLLCDLAVFEENGVFVPQIKVCLKILKALYNVYLGAHGTAGFVVSLFVFYLLPLRLSFYLLTSFFSSMISHLLTSHCRHVLSSVDVQSTTPLT